LTDQQPERGRAVPAVGWAATAVERVQPGISRQVVNGEQQTVIRYVYEPGAVSPSHSHLQEQVTIVLQGAIEFDLNGEIVAVSAGEVVLIPGNMPHGARVLGDELVETINTLSPRRDDHPGG
jgi:quercetin dioxygenase-like cupin family protein